MGAPTTTTRVTPVGRRLINGFKTHVTFAADPDVSLWEVEVTPIGIDGGDAIDITTMHNTELMTKSLGGDDEIYDLSEAQMVVAYDPLVLPQIRALINVETSVTIRHPNADTWTFFGGLRSFTPGNNVRRTMPTATCVITPTNVDPSDGSEQAPVHATSEGTGS